MKTKEQIQKSLIKSYCLKKRLLIYLVSTIPLLVLIAVIFLYYNTVGIQFNTHEIFIACRDGIIAGIVLSCLFILIDTFYFKLSKVQQELIDKIQKNKNKIDSLYRLLPASSALTDATEQEVDIAKKIKRIEKKTSSYSGNLM